jgi:hypothetical protein
MLGKLLTPFTTAAPLGVAMRDVVVSIGVILAMLGTLGLLTPEQVDQIKDYLATITDPAVLAAFGVLMGTGMSIYRIIAKSMSDRGAEVAKETDAKIPKTASARRFSMSWSLLRFRSLHSALGSMTDRISSMALSVLARSSLPRAARQSSSSRDTQSSR